MSKANGVKNGMVKIITWLLVVLLLLGVAGIVVQFAIKEQGLNYYVEYGGQKYYNNTENSNIWISPNQKCSFTVKSITGKTVDFTVKITANPANDFGFILDGKYYQFYSTTEEKHDYTEIFEVQKSAEGFTITIPKGMTVQKAVEKQYGGEIELTEDLAMLDYFLITVTMDKESVVLPFKFEMVITLDTPSIIF